MKIIEDNSVFDINYLPKKELPVRQELVEEVYSKLQKMNKYNLFLAGMPGTGKTCPIKKAIDKLGHSAISVYINCSELNTYTSISKKIVESIKGKPLTKSWKNRNESSEDLRKLLTTRRDKKIIFIFDEIDKLIIKKEAHWEIFFPLLNYGTSSFILISNDTMILEKIDKRIMSRLSPEKKFLNVYNPNEIYQILNQRAELGLDKKSFDSEIIIKIAKFSSDISGDIRFAIKLLENTAVATEIKNKSKLDEEELKKTIEETQISEIEKVFPTLPRQVRWVVVALCNEAKSNGGIAITYPDSFNAYTFLAQNDRKTYGKPTENQQFFAVGERQFRDYLGSLEMLGLFDFQWRSPSQRRGRVRVAIPKFDFLNFLKSINGNNGDERLSEGGGTISVNSLIQLK